MPTAVARLGRAVFLSVLRAGLASFALVFALTRAAAAERIAIVRPDSSEVGLVEVFNRLRGELRMHGFETVLVSDNGVPSPQELRRVSEFSQADAAIALERIEGEPMCHVWFVDHESSEDRVMSIGVPETEDTPTLLALRTVELLRSSLRERAPIGPPPRKNELKTVQPPGTTPGARDSNVAEVPRKASQLRGSVRIGAMFMWIDSQLPAAFVLAPSIGYRLTDRLGLAARFAFPWGETRIDGARASAELRTDFGMLELRWIAIRPHPLVGIEALLAAGVARCSAEGTAPPNSQIQGHSATAWPMAVGLGLGSWFVLAPRWQFGATAGLGALVPMALVRVDGMDTVLGRPWLEVGAGLAYAIF